MQPDSRHVVLFLAAPNIFLPVRKLGIYRSEGHEDALTEGATVLHEPGIYAGDVLMENPIETPCPSLPDVLLPQPGNQLGRLVRYQTPKGPTGETHVRVDYHNRYPFICRMGVNRRRMFPPRINLFAPSSRTAISTVPEVGSNPAISADTFLARRIMRIPCSQSPPVWAHIKDAWGCRSASSTKS